MEINALSSSRLFEGTIWKSCYQTSIQISTSHPLPQFSDYFQGLTKMPTTHQFINMGAF